SSCSATCDDAPLISAANNGLVRPDVGMTSDGPVSGPMAAANCSNATTGRAPLPASADPNQSTNRSFAPWITAAGTSSYRSDATNSASALVPSVCPMSDRSRFAHALNHCIGIPQLSEHALGVFAHRGYRPHHRLHICEVDRRRECAQRTVGRL